MKSIRIAGLTAMSGLLLSRPRLRVELLLRRVLSQGSVCLRSFSSAARIGWVESF